MVVSVRFWMRIDNAPAAADWMGRKTVLMIYTALLLLLMMMTEELIRPTKYCRSYGTSTTSALSGPLAVVTFRLGHFALIYRSRVVVLLSSTKQKFTVFCYSVDIYRDNTCPLF
jgi:hypothetical protein